MSLILDALKRAERERKAHANPVLADLAQPVNEPAPRGRWRQPWRIGGVALLALIAGLLLWSAFRSGPRPAPEAVTAAETSAPLPTAAVPLAPGVIPGTEAVASLDDLADEPVEEEELLSEPQPAPSTPATTPAPAAPPPEQETRPDIESAAPQTQAQPPATGTPSAAPPLDPAVSSEIPPALNQPAPMRKLREMPPDYRADFPALSVEVHVYERELAKRLVMINGRRYREGERLAEGPMVVEIVREGIVFEHRGQQVLYTLGR